MVLRQLGSHMQKDEIGPYFIPHTKINLKWTSDLNVITKAIKLLGKKQSYIMTSYDTKAQAKKKIKKLDFIKVKTFLLQKTPPRK